MDKIKSIPDEWKELVNDDQKKSIEQFEKWAEKTEKTNIGAGVLHKS